MAQPLPTPSPQSSDPVSANTFHAGNTCPHCQETIAAAQLIVTCSACGSIHHETCWNHKNGCSSYHCDNTVRSDASNLHPDIVINSSDLTHVTIVPTPVRRPAAEVAARYAPPAPERISRLALTGAVFAVLALCGIVGVITGAVKLTLLGIVLSIMAISFAVIALVVISNAENRVSGFRLASFSVGLPVLLVIGYFGVLNSHYNRHTAQSNVDLQFAENLPTEEQLAREAPATAKAMRANVVVSCSEGLGETRYGSGIITRLEGHTAYILTNKHVVGDHKTDINVAFYNKEQSTAKIEWSAAGEVDLCILACQVISLDKYQPIQIAETPASPGDRVFAIGNPSGLAWSYTEGTISGLRTSGRGGGGIDVYQTQTPINHGNSGGGLFSMDGSLIGVNTWIEDKAISEGLNFAIAITGLVHLLEQKDRDRFLNIKSGNSF